ncbi:MAG: hypothetical protein AAFO70_02860, partial [Pseudomonadota bacterium]
MFTFEFAKASAQAAKMEAQLANTHEPELRCQRQDICMIADDSLPIIAARFAPTSGFDVGSMGAYLDAARRQGRLVIHNAGSGMATADAVLTAQFETARKVNDVLHEIRFPMDLLELDQNLDTLPAIVRILQKANADGVQMSRIVIELGNSQRIDLGAAYSMVEQLRETGVRVALAGVEIDAVPLSGVAVLRPDYIVLSNTWLAHSRNDRAMAVLGKGLI